MTSKWRQTAVFYQIYPRSFADGNGDGIGDFDRLLQKLDHLQDLGIDAIWLSPYYPSPNWGGGYDISDYCNVVPEYKMLKDFCIASTTALGMISTRACSISPFVVRYLA